MGFKEIERVRDSGHLPPTHLLLQKELMLNLQGLEIVSVCSGRLDQQRDEWQAELRQVLPVQETNREIKTQGKGKCF